MTNIYAILNVSDIKALMFAELVNKDFSALKTSNDGLKCVVKLTVGVKQLDIKDTDAGKEFIKLGIVFVSHADAKAITDLWVGNEK